MLVSVVTIIISMQLGFKLRHIYTSLTVRIHLFVNLITGNIFDEGSLL